MAVKAKFKEFDSAITDLMKELLAQDDAVKTLFNMDERDMRLMVKCIEVYKLSMDLTKEMCKELDDIKSDTTAIKWKQDSNTEILETLCKKNNRQKVEKE